MGTWIWFYFNLLTVQDWLEIINLSKSLSKNEVKSCCLQLNFPDHLQDDPEYILLSPTFPSDSQSYTPKPQQPFYISAPEMSCNFRYSEPSCFKGTGGLSKSSFSTDRIQTLFGEVFPTFGGREQGNRGGKKQIFMHFSRSEPGLSHCPSNREGVGVFAPAELGVC